MIWSVGFGWERELVRERVRESERERERGVSCDRE